MESTFVFDVVAARFTKPSNFFCGAGLQYTPLQEFENALATFVEPFPTPALPGVSIELPSMYLTLFEFCFHESEFVLTVCYQISRQIPVSDKILLSTFLEGDIPETHYISSSLRAFSFVILGRNLPNLRNQLDRMVRHFCWSILCCNF